MARTSVVLPGRGSGGGTLCLLLVAALVSSCGPSSAPGTIDGGRTCTEDNDCPAGQNCSGGLCLQTTPLDGSLDALGPPVIDVSPTVLIYGNPYIGGEYVQSFAIRNLGETTLTVQQLDLVNTPLSEFSLNAPPTPFTVIADPQQPVTVTVTLVPVDNGIPSGAVHVVSDDPARLDTLVQLSATVKDDALLSVCVLEGQTIADGCTVNAADQTPLVDLGNIAYGGSNQRVVALTNAGGGSVAEKITEVKFASSSTVGGQYQLALFVLDGAGAEVPAQLPFYLNPVDPSGQVPQNELRARVSFSAAGIDGPITGVSLEVNTDHPPGSRTTVPIIGQILGCRPSSDGGLPDGGSDPLTDPNNCGYCRHVCALANATPKCVNGYCEVDSCDPSYGDCGLQPGCETDLRSDVNNCGACGAGCVNPHGTTGCVNHACAPSCFNGYDLCGGDPALGCLTSLSSVTDCGTCGHTCANPNGSTSCNGTVCVPSCATGYKDCDGQPDNGCETDTSTLTDCGACGNDCQNGHGTTSCNGTACVPACTGTFADCNGNPSDGCETDLSAVSYCGPCTSDGAVPGGVLLQRHQCEKKHAAGTVCTLAKECASTFCVDGRCCSDRLRRGLPELRQRDRRLQPGHQRRTTRRSARAA